MNNLNLTPQEDSSLKTRLLTLRAIFVMLLGGQLFFACVAVVLVQKQKNPPPQNDPLIFYIVAAFMTIGGLSATLIIRHLQKRLLASASDVNQAFSRFFSSTVIALAIPEAAAMFCMVVVIITCQLQLMLIFFALLILAQFTHFPSRNRFLNTRQKKHQYNNNHQYLKK